MSASSSQDIEVHTKLSSFNHYVSYCFLRLKVIYASS